MTQKPLVPLHTMDNLTDYLPLPRRVLELKLSSTAALLYALLLDRGTLSQKNHFSDEAGHVYVIYTIDSLAAALSICPNAVGRNLKQLEQKGLIQRTRPQGNAASLIYLYLPRESVKCDPEEKKRTPAPEKMHPPTPRKVGTSNLRKQQEKNNRNYQPMEEDSL